MVNGSFRRTARGKFCRVQARQTAHSAGPAAPRISPNHLIHSVFRVGTGSASDRASRGLGERAARRDGLAPGRATPSLKGSKADGEHPSLGLSRQIALRRELDVVANNIANLNTTGFKADGAVFSGIS